MACTFDINEQAFKMEGMMEVGRTEITESVADPGDAHDALDHTAQNPRNGFRALGSDLLHPPRRG